MNKIKNLLIIILIVISFKSYSQEININYSKGNSLLFFDVNSNQIYQRALVYLYKTRKTPLGSTIQALTFILTKQLKVLMSYL